MQNGILKDKHGVFAKTQWNKSLEGIIIGVCDLTDEALENAERFAVVYVNSMVRFSQY